MAKVIIPRFFFFFFFLLTLVVLVAGLSSCKEEQASSPLPTTITFQMEKNNLVSLNGGLMIYGLGPGGAIFGIGLTSESEQRSLTLVSGLWRFLAIGWDGPDKLEGTVRCGVVGQELKGGSDVVALNLTDVNCALDDFNSSTDYLNGNQFVNLKLFSCSYLQGVSSATSDCHYPLDRIGFSRSFRVATREFVPGVGGSNKIYSKCYNNSAYKNTASLLTNIKVPVAGRNSQLFKTVVIGYDELDCDESKNKRSFHFNNGLLQTAKITTSIVSISDLTTQHLTYSHLEGGSKKLFLYLADNDFGAASTPFLSNLPRVDCSGSYCNSILDYPNGNGGALKDYLNSGKSAIWEILGTIDGVFPTTGTSSSTDTHSYIGALGEIRHSLAGDGFGAFLYQQGYRTCESIPTTGSTSVIVKGMTYQFNFGTGSKTIPSGYPGSGNAYEKRIKIYESNQLIEWIEYNCSVSLLKVGWIRSKWKETDSTTTNYLETENQEIYYAVMPTTSTVEVFRHLVDGDSAKKRFSSTKFIQNGVYFSGLRSQLDYENSSGTYRWNCSTNGIKLKWGSDYARVVNFNATSSNVTPDANCLNAVTDFSTAPYVNNCIKMSDNSDGTSICGSESLGTAFETMGFPIIDYITPNAQNLTLDWAYNTMFTKMQSL